MAKQGALSGMKQGGLTELWGRLRFLFLAIIVYRIGAHIPVPGINPDRLADLFRQNEGTILSLFNMFSGGALERMSIFALGIMPYISASIIMQLMTAVSPSLEQLKKEGESGRRKISQYTRYGTLLFASVQGIAITTGMLSQLAFEPNFAFHFTAFVSLVTGAMFMMWLGEQVTERGVGNGISLLIFAGTEVLPGDVASSILGQAATPQALENLRLELGLDVPAHIRYFQWLGGVLTGDLGTALSNRLDIATSLWPRLQNTLFLAFCSAAVAVPLAIVLGLIAVRYRNGFVDKMISGLALSATSLPEFFVGYVLMYFFAVYLGWLPSVSTVHEGMAFADRMRAIVLPGTALTLVVLAHMMRMTRAAILNVMQSAYIETAELKGLSGSEIIRRHALPNAIAPIVNVVVLNLAYLVVGVVVIEVIFVYPGMGQYLVDHVARRDVPVVQAVGLIFAAVYIGLNLIADIIAILANPRLRHRR